ncbi:MAG TPA: hypothetical protein DCS93_17795 [Microscillaceae bacterium]|nr:hypothetical protein [Microscillaceae bacterium]
MEGINQAQWERAKEIARQRQKRFKRQVKVQIAPGTWIYVPKEFTRSKQKLRAFLAQRKERVRQKARQETQEQKDRQQRSKTTYHANRNQQKAKVKRIMGSSSSEQKK